MFVNASTAILIILTAYDSFAQELRDESHQVSETSRQGTEIPARFLPDPVNKNPLEVSVPQEKSELVVAPIPGYNPSQGWMLALAVQNIFKQDSASQPSILAGVIFATEKKSYGGALGYLGRLREDRLKISSVAGYGKIKSDFYGIGKYPTNKDNSILLEQEAKFFDVEALPKVGPVFFGVSVFYIDLKNKFDFAGVPPDLKSEEALHDSFWVPGLKFQWDTRDNYIYPTRGFLSEIKAQFHDENLSGEYTFQKYRLGQDVFFKISDHNVLGFRVHLDFIEGVAPFYSLPSFGGNGGLRGYKMGKYVDNIVWDIQTEFRHRFTDRWGGVIFAGVGDVLRTFSEFSFDDLLSSYGGGVRYRIADSNPMDFRVDAAYGDQEWWWYFSVGQAF